ncbi:MAG: CHAD domain-containing protein, partial [Gemmatimonadaceae bacterium]
LHDFRVALRRLRSWLRAFRPAFADTVSPKVEGRLKKIAKETGSSRDLEVHVAWVTSARRTLSPTARAGATWLLHRLRQQRREADAEFRALIDRKFTTAAAAAEDALTRYESSVLDDGDRFAAVAAETIDAQTEALVNAVGRVTGQGDRAEAHATRIAAKRLRYLLEGVEAAVPDASRLIEELKRLQNVLGELHDAQIFGGELATMIAELLASQGSRPARRDGAAPRPNPVVGLRVLSRRMRRAEVVAFQSYAGQWGTEATAAFAARVASVADELRQKAVAPRGARTRIVRRR